MVYLPVQMKNCWLTFFGKSGILQAMSLVMNQPSKILSRTTTTLTTVLTLLLLVWMLVVTLNFLQTYLYQCIFHCVSGLTSYRCCQEGLAYMFLYVCILLNQYRLKKTATCPYKTACCIPLCWIDIDLVSHRASIANKFIFNNCNLLYIRLKKIRWWFFFICLWMKFKLCTTLKCENSMQFVYFDLQILHDFIFSGGNQTGEGVRADCPWTSFTFILHSYAPGRIWSFIHESI